METGYAALAKRISAWTSKFLLSVLILAAGLGFGRQVLMWWKADQSLPPDAATVAPLSDGLGDPMQLHTIHFGNAGQSLGRQSVIGDKGAAVERLRAACRKALLDAVDRTAADIEGEVEILSQNVAQSPSVVRKPPSTVQNLSAQPGRLCSRRPSNKRTARKSFWLTSSTRRPSRSINRRAYGGYTNSTRYSPWRSAWRDVLRVTG